MDEDILQNNISDNSSTDNDEKETFDLYKNRLMEEIGLDKLPPDQKKEYEEKIESLVNTRIINLILIYLPEEKAPELGDLIEKGDSLKVIEFASANIPSFEDKVFSEMAKIREELLNKLNI